tara:strand:- start:3119 stop:3589 length:471 start_codon:yes stop_codon:yes gene_type:complete
MLNKTNNQQILSNAESFFTRTEMNPFNSSLSGEQSKEIARYMLFIMKNRLSVGAESYGAEVPITVKDLDEWTKKHGKSRDNIDETLEELVDALVYLSAEFLQPLPNSKNSRIKELGLEYKREIREALHHLSNSMFSLLSAKDKRAIYVNEEKKKRR